MIRIEKPSLAPEILRTHGIVKRAELCSSYDSGTRAFVFDSDIYAHPSVKELLIQAQCGKCCFCEALIQEDGQVEHFRPKAAIRLRKGTRLLQPGYYWIAYEWENLLLCCPSCNQQYKGNLFPLSDEQARARCHTDDLSREMPLLIHPVLDDPSEHIEFDKFTARAKNSSSKGEVTIGILQLNRRSLTGRRAHVVQIVRRTLKQIAQLEAHPKLTPEEAKEFTSELWEQLLELTHKDAEFSAVARQALLL